MLADRMRMVSSKKRAVPWVMGGDGGKLAVSEDGINWVVVDSKVTGDILGACYGGDKWIVCGTNNSVAISYDGYNWEKIDTGHTTSYNDITYADGLWVLVGYAGFLATSLDGITWTKRTVPNVGSAELSNVVYGKESDTYKWAVSIDYSEEDCSFRSENGITWYKFNTKTGSMNNFKAIEYANGKWWYIVYGSSSVGSFLYYTLYNYPSSLTLKQDLNAYELLEDIDYGKDGKLIVVGHWRNSSTNNRHPLVLVSADGGDNWAKGYFNNAVTYVRTIAYGNGLWVMAGNNNYLATSTNPTGSESSWVKRTQPFSFPWVVAYGGE